MKKYKSINFPEKQIFARQVVASEVTLTTENGVFKHENYNRDGWVCYNSIEDRPDRENAWFLTDNKFKKLYKK